MGWRAFLSVLWVSIVAFGIIWLGLWWAGWVE